MSLKAKYTSMYWVMCLLVLVIPFELFSQRRSDSRDLGLFKAAFEDAFVIVKQEYALVNPAGKRFTIRGSVPSYYAGILVDSTLYVHESVLRPWETDTAFAQLQAGDTLVPYVKRTSIRSLRDQRFEVLSVKVWDTSMPGVAKLQLPSRDGHPFHIVPLESNVQGMVVTLIPESSLVSNEAAAVRLQIQAASTLQDSVNRLWNVAGLLPGLQKILGGAFFEAVVGPGVVRFSMNALVESKVLTYRLHPLMPAVEPEAAPEEVDGEPSGNAPPPPPPPTEVKAKPVLVPDEDPDSGTEKDQSSEGKQDPSAAPDVKKKPKKKKN